MTDLRDVVTSPARRAAYVAAGAWDTTTLPGAVATHAATRPDARAVVDEHGAYLTYDTLWERATRVARFLADEGIGDGAVVSVQLPNQLDTAVVALGVLAAGAVINPLLPNYRARELAHVFATARPRAVFTPATYRGFDHENLVATAVAATGVTPVHVVCDPVPRAGVALADVLARDRAGGAPAGRDAAAVSELIFTSGTEATPKAIMHTEQTTNFSVRVAADDLGVTGADVVWMPSPIGHSHRVQLRRALRALPRPPAGAPGSVGSHGRVDVVGSRALLVHARGDDVPTDLVAESVAPRLSAGSAALLRLWRRAGAAGVGGSGGRARHPVCGSTARPRCSWRPGTGPARRASATGRHRRHADDATSRSRCGTTRRHRAR